MEIKKQGRQKFWRELKKNEELKDDSSEKGKTESESQKDLQKVEIIEEKQQQVEETTVQKDYHNIGQNIINKGM